LRRFRQSTTASSCFIWQRCSRSAAISHGGKPDTAEFFLGSRSLGSLPLGLSLMAIVSGQAFIGLPGLAYEQGLKCWLIPASFWLIMPVVLSLVVPIYRGLSLYSLYEYLEYRFDVRVRLVASAMFVVWRMLWLAALMSASSQVLMIAAGGKLPPWVLIVLLGLITTAYTYLGGMRAVVWTGVIQALLLVFGVMVVVIGIWSSLDGGPARVMDVARELGRTRVADTDFSWTDPWMIWGALPHWLLVALSLYVADQLFGQRLLCAANVNTARTSYFVSTLALSFCIPALLYVGLCLLAFYHDHPRDMRPQWVVNLNGQTREPVLDENGRPLLDSQNPGDAVTAENIDRLVRERRILRPNDKLPFTNSEDLIEPETDQVMIDKLAMRRPRQGRGAGEIILRRGINEQLLPQFIARRLRWGAAGVVVVALAAGLMSCFAAGLNSIGDCLVTDFHRRLGWGKRWLAHRAGKRVEELSGVDEVKLAQRLTLVIGIVATLLSIAAASIPDIFSTMGELVSAIGAPLLAVFLLGMLTRHTTAAAALAAMVLGAASTLTLAAANKLAASGIISPHYAIAETWESVFGFVVTFGLGYLLSFVIGRRNMSSELRGLVARCGRLGVRSSDETIPLISMPQEQTNEERTDLTSASD
jgi:Na+/proline symporter